MVGAVLAGDGLERVAEIASARAGAPVVVIVPRLGAPVDAWIPYERYVAARLAGGMPQRPPEVVVEVPVSSGGRDLGAVLLLGPGRPDAGEYLHVAAIAALTEVAVAEARDETEQSLRGSFLEDLPRVPSSSRTTWPAGPCASDSTWAAVSQPSAPIRTAVARAAWSPRWRPRCPAR